MSDEEGYIKEGDLVLIKFEKQISECRVLDFSPSGTYMKVGDSMGRNGCWTYTKNMLEVLETSDEPEEEYIDISQETTVDAQDILAKIRNRHNDFDIDESIESEVIHIDKFAELDLRNQKK